MVRSAAKLADSEEGEPTVASAEPFDTSLDPADTDVFWSVVDAYIRARQVTHPYYRLKVEMHRHPNRVHFVRAADLVLELGANPHEYIAGQFVDNFPYPNQLYSKRAQWRWINYVSARDAVGRVASQDQRFRMYHAHLGAGVADVDVLLDPICHFDGWYRVLGLLGLDLEPSRGLLHLARTELRDVNLRAAIRDADYDIDELDCYLESLT